MDAASGDDTGPVDSGPIDAAMTVDAATPVDTGVPVEFTLTSTAFVEGGVIPRTHACTGRGGTNASPPLEWVGAPSGTLSFAVFFTDDSTGFQHSAIYDIPTSRTGLPENVEHTYMPTSVPGARQPTGYPGTLGYAGPCPGSMHRYEFTLYALDVATLPGLDASSDRADVEPLLIEHSLGTATLLGTFTP